MNDHRDKIHSWPKAELHCHLDGSVRLDTLLDIARLEGKLGVLPFTEKEPLQELLEKIDSSESLQDYLAWFQYSIPLLQSDTALRRITYEIAEDNARENVRYLEIRYCPLLHTADGLTPQQIHDALQHGIRAAERDFGIRVRLIVSAVRDQDTRASLEMARFAARNKSNGVVGFDLAGNETGNPAKAHREAFDIARRHLLNISVHAGESVGPESILEALAECGAQRIGHGTSLHRDPALEKYIRDRQVVLEICPTSNVQTGVVQGYESHPIGRYIEAGIPVAVGTDNRLFSRTTVTDELMHVHEDCGVPLDGIKKCVLDGFRYAFLPLPERLELISAAEETLFS